MKLPIYLDYNATTPVDERVLTDMLPYFSLKFGNSSSKGHLFGWQGSQAVESAREKIASLIGAETTEIIFTSGATESIHLALCGVFQSYQQKGKHIVTCCTEHPAVLQTCQQLEKAGAEITYLPVNRAGQIDLERYEQSLRPDTLLVALMLANNETGVVFPVMEMGRIAKEKGILFFTDATQAVGKMAINVQTDCIDLMAFSAHKFYGPKGVGALYMRRKFPRVNVIPQQLGGGQEKGIRAGTLNVPGIVGMGSAAALAASEMWGESQRISILRTKLEQQLITLANERNPRGELSAFVNGDVKNRLPHVTNILFGKTNVSRLLGAMPHVAVSQGAACASGSTAGSHVLTSMGLTQQEATASIRFSLGRFTTEGQLEEVIALFKEKMGDS